MKTNIEGTVDEFKTSIGTQMEQVIQNVSQLQGMYFNPLYTNAFSHKVYYNMDDNIQMCIFRL